MDPRLLQLYNRELQYIREVGAEFAQDFPKIASRLGMEGLECADPYVERLLEGFAFLAARVHLRLDCEFPRFTQHLLESVYPLYLAPIPSMAVVQFHPDLAEGALAQGFVVPRDSVLRSVLGKDDKTACEYRTAHDVTLWPLELTGAEYVPTAASLVAMGVSDPGKAKAGIRLRLRTTAGMTFHELALDRLPLYLRGTEEFPMRMYEQLLAHGTGMVVRPADGGAQWQQQIPKTHIRRLGFSEAEALLPFDTRTFHGYRLLTEYFAFPERYMFVELGGLGPAVQRCQGNELEIFVLLGRGEPMLENVVDEGHFALFCTPAANLFPKTCDRIHLNQKQPEYHLVPDRTRPMDFEVYTVSAVAGHGTGTDVEEPFLALYSTSDLVAPVEHPAYYTLRREQRRLSERQRRQGPRTSYVGSEVFVSLVDAEEAPYPTDLRQLSISALCTNRDLPLVMPVGKGNTDFTLQAGAPVQSIRCVSGPTKPRSSWAEGDTTWRVISHLSLNYLSLADSDEIQGAVALRDLLMLYGDIGEAAVRRQIEGVRGVATKPIIRRMPVPGPISFGRGLEVTVTIDESAYHGSGVFLLGAVLELFFAKYVSINSFTEAVIRTVDRGEVMRWPARIGTRTVL